MDKHTYTVRWLERSSRIRDGRLQRIAVPRTEQVRAYSAQQAWSIAATLHGKRNFTVEA